MPRLILTIVFLAVFSLTVNAEDTYTPGKKTGKTFKGFAQDFINKHCIDCHDNDVKKGDLSLEGLGKVDETNADLWKTVWAQVTLKEMPPKKKSKVEVVERLLFSDWIVEQLKEVLKDKGGFEADRHPGKGNYVDHDLLFGPLPSTVRLVPTSTEARLWRVTYEEHMTRINELVNTEPKFDPAKPGLRTHGDALPIGKNGAPTLSLGTDVYRWPRGHTGINTTYIASLPTVLSPARNYGLANYPDFYTVNSSEANRILSLGVKAVKYMAYGAKSIAPDPEVQVNDKTKRLAKELVGSPRGVLYSTKFVRPRTPVYELMKESNVSDAKIRAAVDYLYEALTFMPPTKSKSDQYLQLTKESVAKLGREQGLVIGLSAIFLDGDALFRRELVQSGQPDAHGRVMMKDWELGLAVNHALCYLKPDAELKQAILSGRMRTKADVKREVERMLADDSIRKPRILQFFRDFFDYDLAYKICKDQKALSSTAATGRHDFYRISMISSLSSTDRLIELILDEDKDVYRQLLTTDKAVIGKKWDTVYWGTYRDLDEVKAANNEKIEIIRKIRKLGKEIKPLKIKLKANPQDKALKKLLDQKAALIKDLKSKERDAKRRSSRIITPSLDESSDIYTRISRRDSLLVAIPAKRKLVTVPKSQRLGILTHPSWLVSQSDAMENHAIHRGKWIREHLLGGGIPDVPITVDAMLPEEPENTLRQRMRVTEEKYCWQCHKKMDPLGLPFEMYNHVGIHRTQDKNKPVDATGEIIDSGVPGLDGKVNNAIEMIEKIAATERAEQVFVRYAFRFWMGRNETLNDRQVLQDAYKAYKESGGSMKALLVSLLTSDAFLYRRVSNPR